MTRSLKTWYNNRMMNDRFVTIGGKTYLAYAAVGELGFNENEVLDQDYTYDPPEWYHQCYNFHDGEFYHEEDTYYCGDNCRYCRECGPCSHAECNYEG